MSVIAESPDAFDESTINDGYSAAEIFGSPGSRGYTFDDVIVLPGSIDFGVDDVNLLSRVTKRISVSSPFCSSPMDTVTSAAMAVAIAQQGGLGFVHCHCSIEEQADMVRAVKKFQNGFIPKPACMGPDQLLSDLDALRKDKNIKGVPITEDGCIGSRLLGFVESKLVSDDFVENRSQSLKSVMMPLDDVTTAQHPCTLKAANKILKAAKASYLCVVDGSGNLVALTTRADLIKNRDFPRAVKTALSPKRRNSGKANIGNGEYSDDDDYDLHRLACGAAIVLPLSKNLNGSANGIAAGMSPSRSDGTHSPDKTPLTDMPDDYQARVTALVEAGVDAIVVDSRHGDTDVQVRAVQWLKETYPDIEVVGGNVATFSQTKRLLEAGVDGLRVGMGVGSVATSQQVKACGRAQLSAIYHSARLARAYGVPVIADGGVASTGAAIKALAMGASCVMMGSMLAGVDESPGEFFFQDGMRLKRYHGTTSVRDGQQSGPSRHDVVFGVAGAVVDKGSVHRFIPFLNQSVKHGLQDMGVKSLAALHESLYGGSLRFEMKSPAAQKEGKVRNVIGHKSRRLKM